MSHREAVFQEALKLSEDDRIVLANALLESVDEAADDSLDMTEEQIQEIRRRQEEMNRDPSVRVPWTTIKGQLDARRK